MITKQKVKSYFYFTDKENKIYIQLLIDYQKKFFDIINSKGQKEFIFTNQKDTKINLPILNLITEAVKFANDELNQNEEIEKLKKADELTEKEIDDLPF